jgi:hypothetical protein
MTIQHTAPIVIDNVEQPIQITRLQRLRRSAKAGTATRFLESFLQHLIHEHPSTLPVDEIEPAFKHLRAVCQELPLRWDDGTRSADNLLINPDGRICIVECKLWNNPEAMREVVAQILTYASALSVLDYDGLLAAVKQTLKKPDGDPIIDIVLGPEAQEEDRESFIDAVSRSLRLGNFLLLVVGDGIRSGVRQIADLLQNASLGFSFGLIEMALYGSAEGVGPYYLQPRILALTEIITRTVFIAGDVAGPAKITKVEPPGRAQTISEQEFFDELGKADANLPNELRSFLAECKGIGCITQLRRNLTLYADDPFGTRINLGGFKREGT